MSYALRIDEDEITKISNNQFPGSEEIKDPTEEALLIPKMPSLYMKPKIETSLKIPKLSMAQTVREHGHGIAQAIASGPQVAVTPMGVYGHIVKMPSLKMNTTQKKEAVTPMGVYGHTVKMPSLKMKTEADSGSSVGAPLMRANETNPKGTDHDKWSDCVDDVTNKGEDVDPYAICGASLQGLTIHHKGKEGGPGSGKHGNAGTGDKKTKLTNPNRLGSVSLKTPTFTKQSSFFKSKSLTRFMESVSGTDTDSEPSRYQVTLISEGLGNFGDGFYYTASALQSGAPLFEGQKCYANHPSSVEEQVLPERSVRDIIGHFENIQCVQNGDHSEIQGQLVVMGGPDYAWVQSQLDHALQFSQKYIDKDFVGLSINAGGNATPMEVQQFLATQNIPPSCVPKIETAMANGLTQVKVVDQITEAISCDLVTQAGAGGRVIQKL